MRFVTPLLFGFVFGLTSDLYGIERPMTTDRPDKTESAFTLVPGRFQFETTIYSNSKDEREIEGQKVESSVESIGDFQIRAGMTQNGEVQLMMPAYIRRSVKTNEGTSHSHGAGDIVLRYRQNMHGNDGSSNFAWAFMPYAKLPTAGSEFSNSMVEGGAMFPVAFDLPRDWTMGAMLNLGHAYNEEKHNWRTDYITTWTLSRSLGKGLSGFIELYSQLSDDKNQEPIGTFDLGLTWQLSPDLQLDLGSFIGITEAAEDKTFFTGMAWRF